MSEGSARGGTAPLGHAVVSPGGEAKAGAAPAPLDPLATQVTAAEPPAPLDPRATQVAASAVPSTLESPKALGGGAAPTAMSPRRADLAGGPAPSGPAGAATAFTPAPPLAAPPPRLAPAFGGELALTIDDVDGAELNDAAMREVARREAAAAAQIERHPVGPPTLVSPGGAGAPFPYPPAPPQVPPPYPESRDVPRQQGAFGAHGAQGAVPMGPLGAYAQPARRPMGGLAIALIICGLVVVIGGGAILAVTFLVLASERAEAVRAAREARTSAPAETAAPPAPPTLPPPVAAPPVPAAPPVVTPAGGARPTPSAHRPPPR